MPAGGGVWQRDDFRYWTPHEQPDLLNLHTDTGSRVITRRELYEFATIDSALSEKETADYTVVARWGVTPQRELLLLDLERHHFEQPKVKDFIIRTVYGAWGLQDVRVESKAAGLALYQDLVREGYPVRQLIADTDKVTRALAAVPRWEAHQVFHPQGHELLDKYERELLGFPNAANDDMVDVSSYAALALPGLMIGPRRRTNEDAPGTHMGGVRTRQF
jgi:predicted phage terminase large subunit-like protein